MKVKVEIGIATWQYAAALLQSYTEERKKKRGGIAGLSFFDSKLAEKENQ